MCNARMNVLYKSPNLPRGKEFELYKGKEGLKYIKSKLTLKKFINV